MGGSFHCYVSSPEGNHHFPKFFAHFFDLPHFQTMTPGCTQPAHAPSGKNPFDGSKKGQQHMTIIDNLHICFSKKKVRDGKGYLSNLVDLLQDCSAVCRPS